MDYYNEKNMIKKSSRMYSVCSVLICLGLQKFSLRKFLKLCDRDVVTF